MSQPVRKPEDDALNLDQFEPPEFLLAKLNGQIREMMNAALRRHGLKLVEWRVLHCLSDDTRLFSVADLAELAVIDRSVASRLVDRMAAKGLVRKQALEQDRRFMAITITAQGRALFEQADSAAQAARNDLFAGLSHADVAEFSRLLLRMQFNAEHTGRR